MKNKWFCNRPAQMQATRPAIAPLALVVVCILSNARPAAAGDAPQWMHAQVNATLPDHDEKTDAVLLYSETNVNVISVEKTKTVERRVYKILRPDGRRYGIVF